MTLAPGIHHDIPMSDYLRLPAVGASSLWTLKTECPAVARYRADHPDEGTAATRLGSAMHTLTLEPEAFAARYAVRPADGPRANSNAYKEWAAEHAAAGREIVSADDWAMMQAMRAAMPKSARRLLSVGKPEVTAICRHDETGMMLKCRPDWMREGIVVNLKTTADVRPQKWAAQAASLGYHASAAMTIDILEELTGERWEYHFLVMAKEPPFISYIASLSSADIELGRQEYHAALMTWAACVKSSDWPAYGDIVNVQLPVWAYPRETV